MYSDVILHKLSFLDLTFSLSDEDLKNLRMKREVWAKEVMDGKDYALGGVLVQLAGDGVLISSHYYGGKYYNKHSKEARQVLELLK